MSNTLDGLDFGGSSNNGGGDLLGFGAPSSSAIGSPSVTDTKTIAQPLSTDNKSQEESPQSIWEKKRAQVLAERQAKADEAKRALLLTAKDEVTKFYAARDDKVAKTKAENRVDEKTTRAEMASLMSSGANMWEKVAKLVNVTPKANEKRTAAVDRMRGLLIKLKSAPTSGGSSSGKEEKKSL